MHTSTEYKKYLYIYADLKINNLYSTIFTRSATLQTLNRTSIYSALRPLSTHHIYIYRCKPHISGPRASTTCLLSSPPVIPSQFHEIPRDSPQVNKNAANLLILLTGVTPELGFYN